MKEESLELEANSIDDQPRQSPPKLLHCVGSSGGSATAPQLSTGSPPSKRALVKKLTVPHMVDARTVAKSAASKTSHLAHDGAHCASHLAHDGAHCASHLAHEAVHGASHLAHGASHLAHEAGHGACHLAHGASHLAYDASHLMTDGVHGIAGGIGSVAGGIHNLHKHAERDIQDFDGMIEHMWEGHAKRYKEVSKSVEIQLKVQERWIINPRSSPWMAYWDMASFMCLFFTAVFTPIEVSFVLDSGVVWFTFNLVVNIFYIVDMVMNFFMAYQAHPPSITPTPHLFAALLRL